jgi:hypothetical protein
MVIDGKEVYREGLRACVVLLEAVVGPEEVRQFRLTASSRQRCRALRRSRWRSWPGGLDWGGQQRAWWHGIGCRGGSDGKGRGEVRMGFSTRSTCREDKAARPCGSAIGGGPVGMEQRRGTVRMASGARVKTRRGADEWARPSFDFFSIFSKSLNFVIQFRHLSFVQNF